MGDKFSLIFRLLRLAARRVIPGERESLMKKTGMLVEIFEIDP